jgi:cytochrome P450 family 135
MLDTENTRHAAVAPASENGASPAESAPMVEHISIRPAQRAISGLPPGPRTPAVLQMLAFWYRRNVFFERQRARFGKRFTIRIRVPGVPFVIISDPEDIKQIFLSPPDVMYCGNGSSELEKYFGNTGLSYLEEERHLARRKVMNRSTHGEAVKQLTAAVRDLAEREVASWPQGEVFSVFPRAHRLTLKVIRHVCFGPDEDERLDELVDVLTEMMRYNDNPGSIVEFQFMPRSVWRLLNAIPPSGVRRFMKHHARADELIYSVIEDRRRAGGDGFDLLSVLLGTTDEDGSPLHATELRDEIMTTFLAGTATVASSTAWGVDLITREPAVQQRLVSEIDAGEDDAYLTATIQEILRRKPPLSIIIPRLVMKRVEINGVTYDPGVRLWPNPHLLHHDPEIYPDPYSFRPERFLDNPPGTYTWIPFGGGRRRCLGTAIADLELNCVLKEIFGRYEVHRARPEPETTRSYIVTVRPSHGTPVSLTPRS